MKTMPHRKPLLPWLIWGAGALAYAFAVINRSSLAALGPATQEHFGIDATTLSMFAMIQLVVYAGLQIPVGIQLDRFGSTTMILFGAVIMVVGQVVMATVSEVWLAILARVLVGAGDACTFISVIRMLPEWFSLRQIATVTQLTSFIGQAGQLIAVTPLALLVATAGWTGGFLGVAVTGVLVLILVLVTVRDRPGVGTGLERMTGRLGATSRTARSFAAADTTGLISSSAPPATSMMPVVRPATTRLPGMGFFARVRRLLGIPGVRLAYWIHFVTAFSMTTFTLLWGTPFLTGGVGLAPAAAGGLLSLAIVTAMVAGLVLGPISSRFVARRVWVAFGITLAQVVTWSAVLLWASAPPFWLLVVLMIVMAVGAPASMISFEVSRSHTPRSFSGFGTGLVNTGGFTSALLVIMLIGLVLDLQGAGSPEFFTFDAFRVAFAVQYPFWFLGLAMIIIERRRTLRWMGEHGHTVR